jgi:hypothetical protein
MKSERSALEVRKRGADAVGGLGIRSQEGVDAMNTTFVTGCAATAVGLALFVFGARGGAEQSLVDLGYEQIGEEEGVSVYRDPDSSVIRLAAEGRLPVPPEKARAVVFDYGNHAKHIGRVGQSRVLERGDDWLLVYQRLELPVVSDRDYVLMVRRQRDGARQIVSFNAVTDHGPDPVDGVVRVTHHEGQWTLSPVDDGAATRARFQTEIDLGGMLPQWAVRRGMVGNLPTLFDDISRLAQRRPE